MKEVEAAVVAPTPFEEPLFSVPEFESPLVAAAVAEASEVVPGPAEVTVFPVSKFPVVETELPAATEVPGSIPDDADVAPDPVGPDEAGPTDEVIVPEADPVEVLSSPVSVEAEPALDPVDDEALEVAVTPGSFPEAVEDPLDDVPISVAPPEEEVVLVSALFPVEEEAPTSVEAVDASPAELEATVVIEAEFATPLVAEAGPFPDASVVVLESDVVAIGETFPVEAPLDAAVEVASGETSPVVLTSVVGLAFPVDPPPAVADAPVVIVAPEFAVAAEAVFVEGALASVVADAPVAVVPSFAEVAEEEVVPAALDDVASELVAPLISLVEEVAGEAFAVVLAAVAEEAPAPPLVVLPSPTVLEVGTPTVDVVEGVLSPEVVPDPVVLLISPGETSLVVDIVAGEASPEVAPALDELELAPEPPVVVLAPPVEAFSSTPVEVEEGDTSPVVVSAPPFAEELLAGVLPVSDVPLAPPIVVIVFVALTSPLAEVAVALILPSAVVLK